MTLRLKTLLFIIFSLVITKSALADQAAVKGSKKDLKLDSAVF